MLKNLQLVRFYDDLAPYWLNFAVERGYHTLILFKKPVGWETADVYAASVLCDENGGALLF